MRKKAEIKVLYIVFRGDKLEKILRYLPKVQSYTSINGSTLSKHFSKYDTMYENETFKVYKCTNIDLIGAYKNNFR